MFLKQDGYYVNRHSCFLLQYHLVLVTKYRHPVICGQLETALRNYTETYFKDRDLPIQAFECMPDHIHILFDAKPNLNRFYTECWGVLKNILPTFFLL